MHSEDSTGEHLQRRVHFVLGQARVRAQQLEAQREVLDVLLLGDPPPANRLVLRHQVELLRQATQKCIRWNCCVNASTEHTANRHDRLRRRHHRTPPQITPGTLHASDLRSASSASSRPAPPAQPHNPNPKDHATQPQQHRNPCACRACEEYTLHADHTDITV
jgi:hypothetical protein